MEGHGGDGIKCVDVRVNSLTTRFFDEHSIRSRKKTREMEKSQTLSQPQGNRCSNHSLVLGSPVVPAPHGSSVRTPTSLAPVPPHCLFPSGLPREEGNPLFHFSLNPLAPPGLVFLPGTIQMKNKDILYRLQVSKARAIVAGDEVAQAVDTVAPDCPSLKTKLLVSEKSQDGWLDFKTLLR